MASDAIDLLPMWVRRLWCKMSGHPWVMLGKSRHRGEIVGFSYGCPRCGDMQSLTVEGDDGDE